MRISAVIPSLDRGALLLHTIRALRSLARPPEEIIVVDQSVQHDRETAQALNALAGEGAFRWERLKQPSIPHAMNHGAALCAGEVVLFLDDDIRLAGELVAAHEACHASQDVAVVAGRILQPWHHDGAQHGLAIGEGSSPDEVQLHRDVPGMVQRFGAGNVSIRRDWLLRVGGFDENFFGAAYRFEADFAVRVLEQQGRIMFEPAACIHHLHCARGGTRSFGSHLSTARPWHSAGRWYYLLRHPATPGVLRITLEESARSVLARRHLRSPWNAPLALLAEVRGILCGISAALRGPRLGLRQEGPR